MSDTVKFEWFMQAARENLDNFERDYLEEHNKNPSFYPLEIPVDNEGVWWEMLHEHAD